MLSAQSLCLFLNMIISERLNTDETWWVGALSEFEFQGHMPRPWVPSPKMWFKNDAGL